jgi:cytidylate kinase
LYINQRKVNDFFRIPENLHKFALTMSNFVITIGRQFGSGGRELGAKIAEILGIEFYDKKLLMQAAQESGLTPDMLERNDERSPGIFSGATPFSLGLIGSSPFAGAGMVGDDAVYRAQTDVIRHLGDTRSCVIVGRTADYVLRDHPRCINVFVHAPEEECVKRILRRGDRTTAAEARAMCRKINKLRASYYNFYTDRQWGAAATYDVTVDSSLTPMDTLAHWLVDYVHLRL